MGDIIFNPDQSSGNYNLRGFRGERVSSAGFITSVVMKLTGIEDERVANQALFVLALFCFLAAAVILWVSF